VQRTLDSTFRISADRSVKLARMGSGPGRPAPWMRAAVAMLAVGWGANQFCSLLLVYRGTSHLPDTFASLAFATAQVTNCWRGQIH
jgi:hypothetical protein